MTATSPRCLMGVPPRRFRCSGTTESDPRGERNPPAGRGQGVHPPRRRREVPAAGARPGALPAVRALQHGGAEARLVVEGRLAVDRGEPVAPGRSIVFCRRDRGTASDDLDRMLTSIRSGLYREPKGGVYFSCLGRGASLFGENSEELRIIRDRLGEVPLVGFFCNGEISHNRLYGYTGVLTLFM